MKSLNEKASKILSVLLATGKTVIDNSNGTHPSIHIEIVNKVDNYNVIAISHYVEQSGVSMRDPEMIILHNTLTGEFIPSNYQNDIADIKSNSASIRDGKLIVWNDKIQADHTTLANSWLETIAEQQKIEVLL